MFLTTVLRTNGQFLKPQSRLPMKNVAISQDIDKMLV